MRLREFVQNNRPTIDQHIRTALDKPDFQIDDRERELWVLNDEGLYNWARQEDVSI